MSKRYTTDEVVAMMSAPSPNVEMLKQPASPFLDPAQINAAERELSQPPPEYLRPETVGTAITDAAGMDRPAAGSSGNMALQNYEAQEAFPIDQTPAPQRPAGGSQTLYPSAQETKPSLPKQRYTTDEVMSLYMQQSKPRYSTKDVMLKMVQPLDDPTMPRLKRDEYFKAKEIKKSLQESGDLPSNWEENKAAVGGFLLTVLDAFATALYKTDKSQGWFEIGGAGFNPALALSETWRRSPATLAYASEMSRQGYAGMAEGLRVMGGPKYRVAESGEFVMDDEESAGGQFGQMDPRNIVDRYKAKGLTLRPVNDEDKKDFEYQQWNKKMDRDLQVERARTAEMPPEFAYRMLVGSAAAVSDYNTGRNDYANITGNVGPMPSQAVVGSMLVDPLTYTTFGAAATRIGISAAAKGATARSLDIIGRAVNKAVKPAEVPLTQINRFRKIVMPPAKVAGAYGLATGAAYAADVMQLPPELKTAAYTAAGLYTAYRGGLGVLRFVGKRFPEASVILRESADPTNGLDIAARKVVATNPNVPSNVRARLERPSQFLSMESTPQRLSQNMALSPGTRKVMEKLSNWYVVQGVRGASDVATGAVKGAIVAAPFAELTRLGGDERAADAMYGIGPALGALGGAANRVFGARGRTIGRAESDIGRMLVDVQAGNKELRSKIGADGKAALQSWNFYNTEIGRMLTDVELAAGDVDALVKNRSFDELARIAAMQGFFRSKVDYIPLGAADFALNADQHGADGSAGFFLSVPDSERARIFVNVDARRADVEPHEFGEAFFSTGAFSPEQVAAMRSGVDARYGLDGVQKRANEYAESLIKASNATNFPNEKLVVSAEQIQAKVNELAQAELQRGGNDPLDWVRREIMVEEWRMAGMDFASIRRNIPEGANPVKFIEDVLGANARALGLSGARVDPETGIPITPEQLFRENPVAADDPVVMSNLKAYTKAYRAWLNDPAHEVPNGVKIAPDGRAESLANNPSVIFDANGQNPLATRDPQTGQVRWKKDKDRDKDAKVRGQQIRNVAGRDLVAPGSPQFGPKKTANGRVRISGRRLPAALELQNHWKPQLDKIRRLEALADGDESTQVLYVAMGNSADKVKTSRPQDIVAINREMVFDEWVVQGKNNDLYGQFLDLTTIRNRAMRAISDRNPALDPARGGPGYSLQAVMDDVYQWMADKRANKDGGATIGADRKNVVNALINPGTNLNREKNPIAGAFGRGSAIKTLLVDNIMAVSGTGRKGAAMDYNWANGNFMPDKPAPRPNMDGDLTPDNNNRMPSALPQAGMAMPEAATGGTRGQAMPDVAAEPKDVYARSLEDIKAVIPPAQRFVGNRAPGKPVVAPDGRPYLQHDLSKPTGNLFVTQADIDSVWEQSINQAGPSARRAIDVLAKRGIVMRPPDEAHWRSTGRLPQSDRFWYETSAEAQVISFPGFAARGESPKVMDTTAATSVMADPNYNAELTISFLSEDLRGTPAQTPAVVPKGVSDALIGTFGQGEQRKIGSFGGTFRFLAGLTEDPPLTTNDRQVAASFGVPDKVFGEFPILYEVATRFYSGLRDVINAGPADKSMGPFEGFQLQALSWVQTRAESRMNRRADIAQQEAFDGDPYPVAFMRAADKLREGGVDVPRDAATGLPVFTDAVLSDPRVTEILAPTAKDFMRDTFQTMEIVTKLTKTGDRFSQLYDESKALGVKGNIKDADAVIARGMNALMTRKDYVDPDFIKLAMQVGPDTPYSIASSVLEQMESRGALRAELGKKGAKATSVLTDLARVFDPRAEETTRIEFGLGTFEKNLNQNLRIPLGSVPEQYRAAYLAILGKPYAQAAQAASSFISTAPGGTPTSYSVFFRGRVDTDFLGDLAVELSTAGHEANISIRPNGIVVDVMPQFGDAGPVPINPARLKKMADKVAGDTTTASVIDRDFSSIYLERPNYAGEINKAKKGLLNDTAREIQKATGATLRAAKDFAGGTGPELSGNKAINRRAEKARDRYRQRLSQLESVQARLRDMAKEFERDMAKANKVMEQKLERARKAKKKPAQPAPAGLDDL